MGLLTKLRLIVLSYQTKFDLKGISWKGGLVKLEWRATQKAKHVVEEALAQKDMDLMKSETFHRY